MNKKRFLLSIVLTFIFLSINVLGSDFLSALKKDDYYNVAYAKPKSSSGGFKSGTFKSTGGSSGGFKSGNFKSSTGSGSSTSGGFKSGSFSNTKKGTSTNGGTGNYSAPTRKSSWSFFPLPIPIPWGGNGYYSQGYGIGFGIISLVWRLIKTIILIALIVWLIRRFRKRF
jgi:hypothetical protein